MPSLTLLTVDISQEGPVWAMTPIPLEEPPGSQLDLCFRLHRDFFIASSRRFIWPLWQKSIDELTVWRRPIPTPGHGGASKMSQEGQEFTSVSTSLAPLHNFRLHSGKIKMQDMDIEHWVFHKVLWARNIILHEAAPGDLLLSLWSEEAHGQETCNLCHLCKKHNLVALKIR